MRDGFLEFNKLLRKILNCFSNASAFFSVVATYYSMYALGPNTTYKMLQSSIVTIYSKMLFNSDVQITEAK